MKILFFNEIITVKKSTISNYVIKSLLIKSMKATRPFFFLLLFFYLARKNVQILMVKPFLILDDDDEDEEGEEGEAFFNICKIQGVKKI